MGILSLHKISSFLSLELKIIEKLRKIEYLPIFSYDKIRKKPYVFSKLATSQLSSIKIQKYLNFLPSIICELTLPLFSVHHCIILRAGVALLASFLHSLSRASLAILYSFFRPTLFPRS